MTNNITYEQLYNNMVSKFTVEKDNRDYKLGEYMLMKAKAKKEAAMVAVTEKSNLPAVKTKGNGSGALVAAFSYVGDKLTVKQAPLRDKTLRAFPFRTSLTAFCSALVVCGLIVCCSVFGIKSTAPATDNVISSESVINETDSEIEETFTVTEN